jgi:histidine triad (HIT) family protein
MASIFTRILNGEIPAHLIAEDERYFAFLDVFPLVEGHTLIIPRHETDYLFDLDPDLLGGLLQFARPIAHAIKKACPCRKVGVSVVGLEVPHAHMHLIPINAVDDMNFSRAKLKPSSEELAGVASRIRTALNH